MKLDRSTAEKVRKLAGLPAEPKKEKYGRKRVYADGMTFDSRREYRRWLQLRLLEDDGQVADLRRQVAFPLVVNGVTVGRYTADFVYLDMACPAVAPDARIVVEDCKGYRDTAYRLRKRVFEAATGFKILET